MGNKAKVGEMLVGGDGVHVFQEGQGFGVGFAYSNTLRSKLVSVPGANYDKEAGCWKVPAASVDMLVAAVDDMRDFVHSGGVQIKDGFSGKYVLFDYEKALAQEMGPIAGAEFDKKAGSWHVMGDSKALVAEQGKVSYFDLAVNRMRGIVVEIGKAHDNITELAATSAKLRDCTPGIHYPEVGQSYTGPIVNANGYYAAQLTGIDDKKNVAFITIHKQADLGQEVLKGDDLRIDYGANHAVKIRTTAIFQQQQQEREQLTALAQSKMDGASVWHASSKDDKAYSGKVIEATDHFVLQHTGREQFTLHDRSKLSGAFTKGDVMDVKYKGGAGLVSEKEKGRETASVGR